MRLGEEQLATFRRVFADPVVGFASYDGFSGSLTPLSATDFTISSSLIVHCSASVEIYCTEVEILWGDEVYPWLYFPMSAQARVWPTEPWSSRGIQRLDPPSDEGLDLLTPLGQVVEVHALSVVIPAGPGETTIELDTALVLKAGSWRLLLESLEHCDDYQELGPELLLITDPDTIDKRLSRGVVRQLDQQKPT